jgi:CBS domain-containing protein
MTNTLKVSEVMTKSVIVANTSSTFTQVMRFFTEYKIQHLPVAEGDKIVGIVTVNDMIAYMFKEIQNGKVDMESLDASFKLGSVMTDGPVTITPDDTIDRVVDLLSSRSFQALPVTVDGAIQGIVTNKDLVRMLHWEYRHY